MCSRCGLMQAPRSSSPTPSHSARSPRWDPTTSSATTASGNKNYFFFLLKSLKFLPSDYLAWFSSELLADASSTVFSEARLVLFSSSELLLQQLTTMKPKNWQPRGERAITTHYRWAAGCVFIFCFSIQNFVKELKTKNINSKFVLSFDVILFCLQVSIFCILAGVSV